MGSHANPDITVWLTHVTLTQKLDNMKKQTQNKIDPEFKYPNQNSFKYKVLTLFPMAHFFQVPMGRGGIHPPPS